MQLTRTFFTPSQEATEKVSRLEEVLLDPNPEVLRHFSASDELGETIPEWGRLIGPRNIQHATHHFPLDDHTFKVIEKAKSSFYYKTLSDYQRFITTLAALLHDIDKNTGPPRLKGKLPVDKLHPIKSAERSGEILGRLEMPPKTIQRVYTLIHHHQVFGRLFIMFPNGADHWSLRKIALKIRSLGVLDCLLALSEGDIRAVQRGDAFFTPRVADELADYAEIVREEIQGHRRLIPLFPQALVLDSALAHLDLDKSACFVITAQNWPQLMALMERLHWGGAHLLQYHASLKRFQEDSVACAALIRFLPENIAYWGPQVEPRESLPAFKPMSLFYSLLLREPLSAISPQAGMSSEELSRFAAYQSAMLNLETMLQSVSERQGYENWVQSTGAFEEGWFEPSDFPLPVDPLLVECAKAYQEFYTECACMGIGTRPILMGFYSATAQSPELPSPWDTVPIFRAL